jgi:hypothetical protein
VNITNNNNRRMFLLAAVVTFAGCAAAPTVRQEKTITTDPSGATVYANKAEIGQTPLTVVPDKVWPPRFVNWSYRRTGTLTIKKPGCKTYTREMDDSVLREDMHVKLDCDPNYKAPAPAASSQMPPSTSAPTSQPEPARRGDLEFRLRRLESLHDKGLITDKEYRSIRQKILEQL